jgi:hypothetical protein
VVGSEADKPQPLKWLEAIEAVRWTGESFNAARRRLIDRLPALADAGLFADLDDPHVLSRRKRVRVVDVEHANVLEVTAIVEDVEAQEWQQEWWQELGVQSDPGKWSRHSVRIATGRLLFVEASLRAELGADVSTPSAEPPQKRKSAAAPKKRRGRKQHDWQRMRTVTFALMNEYGMFGPTVEGPTPKGWDHMERLIEVLQDRFGISRTSLYEKVPDLVDEWRAETSRPKSGN